MPEFGSRILKCFYGIHAAGIKGGCCYSLPLFRALHFMCSLSRCSPDSLALVKTIAATHFCKQVPFSQEKLFKVTSVDGTINEVCMERAYGTACLIKDCKSSLIQYVFIQNFDGVCVQMLLSINLYYSQAEKIQTDNRSWHMSSKSYTLGISNKIKGY